MIFRIMLLFGFLLCTEICSTKPEQLLDVPKKIRASNKKRYTAAFSRCSYHESVLDKMRYSIQEKKVGPTQEGLVRLFIYVESVDGQKKLVLSSRNIVLLDS